MLTDTGTFVFNGISESGRYAFSGITETGAYYAQDGYASFYALLMSCGAVVSGSMLLHSINELAMSGGAVVGGKFVYRSTLSWAGRGGAIVGGTMLKKQVTMLFDDSNRVVFVLADGSIKFKLEKQP